MKYLRISLFFLLVAILFSVVKTFAYTTGPVVITKEVSYVTKHTTVYKTKTSYCDQLIKVEDSLNKGDTYSAQPIDEDGYKYQTSTHMRVSNSAYKLDDQVSHPNNFKLVLWRDNPKIGLKRMAYFVWAPNCVF